jgi:glycine dehydrogenase subunit 2
LDKFVDTVIKIILKETLQEPQKLKEAPINTPVRKLNEVEAARKPILKWQ